VDISKIMQIANDPQTRPMLQSLFQQFSGRGGGSANLMGMVQQMSKSGLADQVGSWTGNGQNASVSGDQVRQALGDDALNRVAQDSGGTPDQAANKLAGVLPDLIDSATSDGKMADSPEVGNLLGGLSR
jgi:uncharacterized protein YidB (DUF937 family)